VTTLTHLTYIALRFCNVTCPVSIAGFTLVERCTPLSSVSTHPAVPHYASHLQSMIRYSVKEAASAVARGEAFARGGTGDVFRAFVHGKAVAIKVVA
jgi:hypothetical protein